MSLLTDTQKIQLQDILQSGVRTFFRPLTVYQEATRTVLISDPNYNPYTAYNQNVTTVQNTPVYTIISGAVLWDKMQEIPFVHPSIGAAIKVKDQTSRAVRIKTDASGFSLLQNCKKIEIDGALCDRDTNPRPHGLFFPDRYTFYFVRSS